MYLHTGVPTVLLGRYCSTLKESDVVLCHKGTVAYPHTNRLRHYLRHFIVPGTQAYTQKNYFFNLLVISKVEEPATERSGRGLDTACCPLPGGVTDCDSAREGTPGE
jgi:hypothetical protein